MSPVVFTNVTRAMPLKIFMKETENGAPVRFCENRPQPVDGEHMCVVSVSGRGLAETILPVYVPVTALLDYEQFVVLVLEWAGVRFACAEVERTVSNHTARARWRRHIFKVLDTACWDATPPRRHA